MSAIVDQGSYTASSLATIYTASSGCTLFLTINNHTTGLATISELSRSATVGTDPTGRLRPIAQLTIEAGGSIDINPITLDGTVKYLQLACDVDLQFLFNGATQ